MNPLQSEIDYQVEVIRQLRSWIYTLEMNFSDAELKDLYQQYLTSEEKRKEAKKRLNI